MSDAFGGGSGKPTGSQAFGATEDGSPTGSESFGGADADDPLRGAILFGNDPRGGPTGAEAFGGADERIPLRGAILFGNDPRGNPAGSESFGGADEKLPLRGALLFGNDPRGNPRGSEAFGNADEQHQLRGSQAFGAGAGGPERLKKDPVGYDFAGVILIADDSSIAGVRKGGNNPLRERLLRLLGRRLGVVPERLRHGLGEDSVPWGKLKRQPELDRQLAYELRSTWRRAPGEVLGIGQTRDVLERLGRMHSCELRCEWDLSPVQIAVSSLGKPVAHARSAIHKQHAYFVFTSPEGQVLAYVDALAPRRAEQVARIRDHKGVTLATVRLLTPTVTGEPDPRSDEALFQAALADKDGVTVCEVREQRASAQSFLAALRLPEGGEEVGLVRDQLASGKIRTTVELDLMLPRPAAWGLGVILADLARLRRRGWPKAQPEAPETAVESVEDALGPRRRG